MKIDSPWATLDPASTDAPEVVHRCIVGLARERAANDYHLCRWLLRGDELRVERCPGYASLREYAERVVGESGRGLEDRDVESENAGRRFAGRLRSRGGVLRDVARGAGSGSPRATQAAQYQSPSGTASRPTHARCAVETQRPLRPSQRSSDPASWSVPHTAHG